METGKVERLKRNRFWVLLLMSVVIVSAAVMMIISRNRSEYGTAKIYQDGECLYAIDLAAVEEPYQMTISGNAENVIEVEKGRIRVVSATCPDHICVEQGWISDSITPIVCLPNALVIQLEKTDETADAITMAIGQLKIKN